MKRILIIRLDKLGDTLLSLPLIEGLKSCWPECEITCLVSPRGAPVFAADSRISRLWEVELSTKTFSEKMALGQQIHREAFDLVFCLAESTWPTAWSLMSSAPQRVGFSTNWLQPTKSFLRKLAFTHSYPWPTDKPDKATIHEVERYAALASLVGCTTASGPMRLAFPPDAIEWADKELLSHFPTDIHKPICFHLSPKWAWEGWAADSDLYVIREIMERFPERHLIITAGWDESALTHRLRTLPQDRYRLYECLSIAHWGALLSKCGALVSMDTGVAHLAAAVNTPVVDVFQIRNFTPISSRWKPWQVPHKIIQRPDPSAAKQFYADICSALAELL